MKFKTDWNESEWNMQLSNVTSVVTTRTFKSGFNPNTKNLPECQFPRQTPSGRKVRGRKKKKKKNNAKFSGHYVCPRTETVRAHALRSHQ